jgi:hypothetical protein
MQHWLARRKQIATEVAASAPDRHDVQFTVRAFAPGNRAILEVEDTGHGFKDLNRALDPFYTTKSVGRALSAELNSTAAIVSLSIHLANLSPSRLHRGFVMLLFPVDLSQH